MIETNLMEKITKEQFKSYLSVQKSGITNMFDVHKVQILSGLERETIFDIMKNYSKYLKNFQLSL